MIIIWGAIHQSERTLGADRSANDRSRQGGCGWAHLGLC